MKRFAKLIALIYLGFFSIKLSAQTLSELKPLKVGDKIPDVPLVNIFKHKNSNGGTLLSEFGGKPLIIDRWNTHCAPCIDALPLMDSIQKENAGRLNILLVNSWLDRSQKLDLVKNFLTTNPYLKNVTLPTTIMDSVMAKLFPGEPYQVWIDQNGIVRSISESGQVNRENVKSFLAGKPLKLNQVKIEKDPYRDPEKYPLMVINENYNQGKGRKYYSYISGYDSTSIRPVWVYGHPVVDNRVMYMRAFNYDLFQLYNAANPNLKNYDFALRPYQFILKNPERFRRAYPMQSMYIPDSRDFEKLYCYQMISADTSATKAFRTMKNDLDNLFNMESSFEKKMLPCYVIKRIDPKLDLLKSKGADHQNYRENNLRVLVNEDWSFVLDRYLRQWDPYTVNNKQAPFFIPYEIIDETGYEPTFKVDLAIPVLREWKNLDSVNEKLKQFNLKVSLEDRKIDVVVLNDRNI